MKEDPTYDCINLVLGIVGHLAQLVLVVNLRRSYSPTTLFIVISITSNVPFLIYLNCLFLKYGITDLANKFNDLRSGRSGKCIVK
jgi:hypothetical protein